MTRMRNAECGVLISLVVAVRVGIIQRRRFEQATLGDQARQLGVAPPVARQDNRP